MEPLDFGTDTKLCIYQCAPEMENLRWKRFIPSMINAPIFLADLYHTIFAYQGIIFTVIPLIPIVVLAGMQRNLN